MFPTCTLGDHYLHSYCSRSTHLRFGTYALFLFREDVIYTIDIWQCKAVGRRCGTLSLAVLFQTYIDVKALPLVT